ncbi:2TM domain-containing protein [Flavobacterium sp. MK4S-17]|uniref:2TM domain-containing protein n=1 Tax=Flavobacterium sp. MK4S-17 TaxID=2543737 RepID=UPI001358AF39|nr:2TM domain-containing protein [Flavobacterium sp. MK4S-17]
MKTYIREIFRSLIAGTLLFLTVVLVFTVLGKINWETFSLAEWYAEFMLFAIPIFLANSLVFIKLDRVFGTGNMSLKRVAIGFVASGMVTMILVFLLLLLHSLFIEGNTIQAFFAAHSLGNYRFTLLLTLIVNTIVHIFYFYRRYQENRVKAQKIVAGVASAQFESLKNQIDPHFLFNSLNVLSSLIEENPESAQRFTTSLSKVYRYVLEQRDKELVSVQEELAFAKTYMNLLKMRFENSISFEIPQDFNNQEARVVPLSLQLLLENTIKHNVVSQQRPLHIRIFEEKGYLVVQNDLQKKEVLQDRKGVGLQNIVSRYAILTSRNVLVEQTEKHFTVKLPILTKQVSIMETQINTDKESAYYKAQKKVEEIKGFYGNLTSYVVVILGLMVLNLYTSAEHLWFIYPAIGWGVGVIIHGMSVFNYMPFAGRDWEERKIREYMEKEKNNKWD